LSGFEQPSEIFTENMMQTLFFTAMLIVFAVD